MKIGAMKATNLTLSYVWPEFMLSVEEAGSLNADQLLVSTKEIKK
jgi:hypothetical protein